MPESGSFLHILNNIFDVIFVISFLLCFIVDYQPPDSPKPIKDVSKIAMRYLKGNFVYDFLPLIPFTYLPLGGDERLFFLIRL